MTKKFTIQDVAVVNFVALHESMKNDPTVAPVQRTYMTTKAALDTIQQAYTGKLDAEFPDLTDSDTDLDSFMERCEALALELNLPFFRAQFGQAEELLIKWGLLMAKKTPEGAANAALLEHALKTTNVTHRQKLIDVILRLDASTVPSTVNVPKPQFAPGEQVRYINSNGVDWGIRTIVSVEAISYSESGVGYKIEPTDSPWYAVPENQLSRVPKR